MVQKFAFEELQLKGSYLISVFFASDQRGGFLKDYSRETFKANGVDFDLKETFYTISHKGVIRALHFQEVYQQPKLVRCISGKIYDVIVDLRKDSPTFKQWLGFTLTGEGMNELFVPAHFAHGYLVLEDSIVSYKCSEKFYGEFDSGIAYDDHDIGVVWPFEKLNGSPLILSEKDKNLQSFKDYVLKGCK